MAVEVRKDGLEFRGRVLCDLHLRGFVGENGRRWPRRATIGSCWRSSWRSTIDHRGGSIWRIDTRQRWRFQREGCGGITSAMIGALVIVVAGGAQGRHERDNCKGKAISHDPGQKKKTDACNVNRIYSPRERAMIFDSKIVYNREVPRSLILPIHWSQPQVAQQMNNQERSEKSTATGRRCDYHLENEKTSSRLDRSKRGSDG